MLMFPGRSGLAQVQSLSTGASDERPIDRPSEIDWTFNFDAGCENARVDFGTHWFEGSSVACGMVNLADAH
jgi:hypothetical protein